MVRTIKLSDGKSIPAIAWGNGTGGVNKESRLAIDSGVTALKAGIPHIDTAQVYGTEEETGKSISEAGFKRDDVFVTTKISSSSNVKTTPESIRENVQESIKKLGFLPDLLLIHNPFVPEEGKIAEFWKILEDLVEDGTLKGVSLGVSNFRPQDLQDVLKVAKIKPVANQLEYHPYVLTSLDPILEISKEHNIVIESFGPLTPILRHPSAGSETDPLKPVLTRIAKRLAEESGKDVDEAAVLLLWTIQKGVVAVTSSKNPDNIKKIAAVNELPDLKAEEVAEIEKVGRTVHYRYYTEHLTKDYPAPSGIPNVKSPKDKS